MYLDECHRPPGARLFPVALFESNYELSRPPKCSKKPVRSIVLQMFNKQANNSSNAFANYSAEFLSRLDHAMCSTCSLRAATLPLKVWDCKAYLWIMMGGLVSDRILDSKISVHRSGEGAAPGSPFRPAGVACEGCHLLRPLTSLSTVSVFACLRG